MEKKGNIFTQIIREYKKVHWADKVTVFHTTIIVLLITLFVAIYIMGFDFLFNRLINIVSSFITKLLQ